MRLHPTFRHVIATFALVLGCGDATAPTSPSEAAGAYTLEKVEGRGPVSGVFILNADGSAERRVRYTQLAGEDVMIGSFEVTPPGIVFTLHPQSTPAAYVWTLHGEWTGDRFSIRYPDPADGPDIIETFRR